MNVMLNRSNICWKSNGSLFVYANKKMKIISTTSVSTGDYVLQADNRGVEIDIKKFFIGVVTITLLMTGVWQVQKREESNDKKKKPSKSKVSPTVMYTIMLNILQCVESLKQVYVCVCPDDMETGLWSPWFVYVGMNISLSGFPHGLVCALGWQVHSTSRFQALCGCHNCGWRRKWTETDVDAKPQNIDDLFHFDFINCLPVPSQAITPKRFLAITVSTFCLFICFYPQHYFKYNLKCLLFNLSIWFAYSFIFVPPAEKCSDSRYVMYNLYENN